MDERLYFTIGTCLAHTLSWGIPNLILYMFHRFKWFEKFKIQGPEAFPDVSLIKACIQQNIVGHLIVVPLAVYYGYPLFKHFGMVVYGPFPPLAIVLRDFVVFVAFNDTLFYWAHRALHHRSIYKYIHKQHHEFKVPIGISSKYANPIEDLIANTIPTIIGPILMGSHAHVIWLWLFIRLLETVDAHSGYSFPWSPFHYFSWQGGAERHDFHHSHNVGCYGSFTIFWDWITGTDQQFLEYQARKRTAEKKVN
jgi:plant 4alpha-monomethylsterol monooxygenase